MSTKGGGPGDVHNYFNPHSNPIEAFVTYSGVLANFEAFVLKELEKPSYVAKRILRKLPPERGFTFHFAPAKPTKWVAHSLEEFHSILKRVDLGSIRFHNGRGDFERWMRWTVGDSTLADQLASIAKSKLAGHNLRERLLSLVGQRIKELEETIKASKLR
jgi:alpha-amylase